MDRNLRQQVENVVNTKDVQALVDLVEEWAQPGIHPVGEILVGMLRARGESRLGIYAEEDEEEELTPIGYIKYRFVLLVNACLDGNVEDVKTELERGAFPCWKLGSVEFDPLFQSVKGGSIDIVHFLVGYIPELLADGNLDRTDHHGRTMVWWAAYKGHDQVLRVGNDHHDEGGVVVVRLMV